MERKPKVKLTFLGGVNEVGGNAVLLEDFEYQVKIFFDFGINIKKLNDNYEEHQEPSSINELISLGILPDFKQIGLNNIYFEKLTPEKPNNQDCSIDGILISHPHKDHFLGLSFINKEIPIYAGQFTRKIISAYSKCSKSSLMNNFEGIKWNLFRTGDILNIKGLEIIPVHVDHSIPAAYGFIVKSSAGIIAYTGDFRLHGPLSSMTNDFINKIQETFKTFELKGGYATINCKNAPHKIKVLMCEGTHIHKASIESENEVHNNLEQLFNENPFDFAMVKYDRLDWDRFRTFSHIAKKYGWYFIITEKDAYFYYLLNNDEINDTMKDPNILNEDHILILTRGSVKYRWQEEIRQAMYKNDKGSRLLKNEDLEDLNEKFFYYITTSPKEVLKRIRPTLTGVFISSSVDPYTEEFIDNHKTLSNVFNQHGIPAYQVHASGHIMPHHLINLINKLSPQYLIPIHTDHANLFRLYFRNTIINVILPNKYETFEF
ncbi:MAG: MBL fold metallo-hydrolase [Candidatus Thorarchaeota archaeon]